MIEVYELLDTLAKLALEGESDRRAVLRLINAFLKECALESLWAREQRSSIVASWALPEKRQIDILEHIRSSVALNIAEMRKQGQSQIKLHEREFR